MTEYYRLRHGLEYAYWPHYWLRNTAVTLNKYKFNLLLKSFLIYTTAQTVVDFRNAKNSRFLRLDEIIVLNANIAFSATLTGTALMLF